MSNYQKIVLFSLKLENNRLQPDSKIVIALVVFIKLLDQILSKDFELPISLTSPLGYL